MTTIFVLVLLTVAVLAFLRLPVFGAKPSGARLARIRRSSNFQNGQFVNLSETPQLTGNKSIMEIMWEFLFARNERKPRRQLPCVKTDLKSIASDENILVWFGHSSYYLQCDGMRFLVDPVFSGHASPFAFTTRSFRGTEVCTADDFPSIDYLILSHDHYDHLDYETVRRLRPKVGKVITGLGVGAHLERWGYTPETIAELDWNESYALKNGTLTACAARHFSGRLFNRNNTLWCSFVLETPRRKIFIGGDSGYDSHFADIGKKFGPFDLAILECGQYNENWKFIHMFPEQVVSAAKDLHAKVLMPVHWGKFALALHPWDTPPEEVTRAAARSGPPLTIPLIGKKTDLDSPPVNMRWWKTVSDTP